MIFIFGVSNNFVNKVPVVKLHNSVCLKGRFLRCFTITLQRLRVIGRDVRLEPGAAAASLIRHTTTWPPRLQTSFMLATTDLVSAGSNRCLLSVSKLQCTQQVNRSKSHKMKPHLLHLPQFHCFFSFFNLGNLFLFILYMQR